MAGLSGVGLVGLFGGPFCQDWKKVGLVVGPHVRPYTGYILRVFFLPGEPFASAYRFFKAPCHFTWPIFSDKMLSIALLSLWWSFWYSPGFV